MLGPDKVYISIPLALLGVGLVYLLYFGLPYYEKRTTHLEKRRAKKENKN